MVLHSFALYELYQVALPWLLKCLIGLGVFLVFIWIVVKPSTILNVKQLAFFNHEWTVYYHNDSPQSYEKHRIILEAGIFFLLEFSSESQRKTVVIFFDQLSPDDYRLLRLKERFV